MRRIRRTIKGIAGVIHEIVTRTISGFGSVSLPQAITNGLNYVKAFGKAKQKTNLPSGYTRTVYTANNGTTTSKIDTGLMPMEGDVLELKILTSNTGMSFYALQARAGAGKPIYGISGSTSGNTISADRGTTITSNIARTVNHDFYIRASFVNGVANIYVKDLTNNTEATNTGTYSTITPESNYFLWGNSAQNLTKINPVYEVKITNNGVERLHYIPCIRDSDDAIGFYDLVAEEFVTNETRTSGTITPSPSTPLPIICNNGELKMIGGIPGYKVLDYAEFVSSYIDTGIIPNVDTKTEIKFLFTSSVGTQNLIGSRMASTGSDRSAFAVYVISGTNMRFDWSSGGRYVYNLDYTQDMIITQDGKDNYVDGELKNTQTGDPLLNSTVSLYVGALNQYNGSPVSFLKARVYYFKVRQNGTTISRDCIPVQRLSDNKVGFWDKVNEEFLEPQGTRDLVAGPEKSGIWTLGVVGDTETIVDSLNNTATAENLLSIQGYEDVQEILSGQVKRNVGVMVLNGSEDWGTDTYGGYRRFYFTNSIGQYSEAIPLICTHYIGRQGNKQTPNSVFLPTTGRLVIYPDASQNINTVADWQTYLRTQYIGGTPVMIVYPLATETTETVTGQTLNTNTGTNTIAITQASIDPSELKLEVEYQALI